jgi:glycosyltransferase involved in cell wall biosynthesis
VRILFCLVEAPLPPPNGFRLAVDALLRELAQLGHELRVIGLRASDQHDHAGEDMRLLRRRSRSRAFLLARATLLRRPLTADLLAGSVHTALVEELESFRPDVVHVSSGRLAALGKALNGRPSVLAALDAWHVNVEADAEGSRGVRQALLLAEAARVRRFEAREYRRFGRVVVVSEADREALLELDPRLAVEVISNGVDPTAFSPDRAARRHGRRIVFTGVMDYAPNVAAADFLARRVLPRVRTEWPEAQLAIVGRKPAPSVLELAELPGVTVTGEVPDVAEWLAGSRAYACPMVSGTGIKNKLLEAMACGLPCVATQLALRGLHVQPGVHVLVGETEDELARQLVHLLADDSEARRLGEAARAYVLGAHDWAATAAAYERVYADTLALPQKP